MLAMRGATVEETRALSHEHKRGLMSLFLQGYVGPSATAALGFAIESLTYTVHSALGGKAPKPLLDHSWPLYAEMLRKGGEPVPEWVRRAQEQDDLMRERGQDVV